MDFLSVPWQVESYKLLLFIIAILACVSSAITLFNDVTYLQCIAFCIVKLLNFCKQKVTLPFWRIGA